MKGQNVSWKIIIKNEHVVFGCCVGLEWIANDYLVQRDNDAQIFIVYFWPTKCFDVLLSV